jgi:uncharacterized membrane protein YebE (DUF533 family)
MTESEARAVLTVALMAAFSDGLKDERERALVKTIANRLGGGAIDVAALYDDVLLRKPALPDVVRPLVTEGARQYAYEMAVGVIDADGAQTPAEAAFLAELAGALGLPAAAAKDYASEADAVAAVPIAAVAGGLLLGLLESFTAGYLNPVYKDAVALIVLLVVLFVRPQGLLGGSGRVKV